MPLVLALEPDLRQAGIIKRVIREQVKAELVLVDSRDAAIAALQSGVPDVVLITALLSPRDEEELITHLRALPGAEHLQTHTIPQLASGHETPDAPRQGGLLGKFRRKKESEPMAGCDPSVFAGEVRAYLQRAAEMKVESAAATQQGHAAHAMGLDRAPAGAYAATPVALDIEPIAAPVDSWSSPFEWRRSPAQDVPIREVGHSAATSDLPPEGGSHIVGEGERQRTDDVASAFRRKEAEAQQAALELERERERLRVEAEEQLERERQRLEAEAAAERERLRLEAEAVAERERLRLEAEAAAERERERRRLEAEAAAERERLRREAEAAAERERRRLEAEAAAERERLRAEAEAAARRERERLEAEARRERERLEAEAAAERERLRIEADAAAERERRRLDAEAAAERERLRVEAEAEARRERERLEAEAAAERERLQLEMEAAAERERLRMEMEFAAERELAARAAQPPEPPPDPFAEFRLGDEQDEGIFKLMPVSAWARRIEAKTSSASDQQPGDELRSLMSGLLLPPPVAAITYPHGCRIRRVRVPPAAVVASERGDKRPVIVSRRALDEARR